MDSTCKLTARSVAGELRMSDKDFGAICRQVVVFRVRQDPEEISTNFCSFSELLSILGLILFTDKTNIALFKNYDSTIISH